MISAGPYGALLHFSGFTMSDATPARSPVAELIRISEEIDVTPHSGFRC